MEQARTRKVEQAARGRPLRPWGLEPGGGLASADGGLDELRQPGERRRPGRAAGAWRAKTAMPASWAEARGQLEQEADVKLFLDTPEQDVWVDQGSRGADHRVPAPSACFFFKKSICKGG